MSRKSWSKLLKAGLPAVLAIGLIVGLAIPSIAASNNSNGNQPDTVQVQLLRGKVTAVAADNNSFEIQSGKQEKTTVTIDNTAETGTKYFLLNNLKSMSARLPMDVMPKLAPQLIKPGPENKAEAKAAPKVKSEKAPEARLNLGKKNAVEDKMAIPGILNSANGRIADQKWQSVIDWLNKNAKEASFSNIAVGDYVIIQTLPGQTAAKNVVIIKMPVITVPDIKKATGVVSNLNATAKTFTLTPSGGTAINLTWDNNTRFMLQGIISFQDGQTATVVYDGKTSIARDVAVRPASATSTSASTQA